MLLLDIYSWSRGYSNGSGETWELILYIGLPFAAAGAYWWHVRRKYRKQNQYWVDGVFPADLERSPKHLMMAHLAAAAAIVRRDKVAMVGKMGYIHMYFQQKIGVVDFKLRETFEEALFCPVKIQSLTSWFNKHLDETERLEVVRFLTGLAFYDGSLNDAEYAVIRAFCGGMALDAKLVEPIIDEYARRQQRTGYSDRSTSPAGKASQSAAYAEVLGLSDPFTQEEVKSAYRRLVMIYHPDKFQKDSEAVKQKAHEKFLELQEAYEFLSKT